eukprot:TRINITY_DN46016_c0_g1_i1.p1 TRINITY_DN46016_c0_g1~~TRINITY_DN46016_c0_g1_i1.p1  ORF type:complete len:801 (-),score=129.37 TRINITY_DN46016_c0_g1_i1:4-2379(-)
MPRLSAPCSAKLVAPASLGTLYIWCCLCHICCWVRPALGRSPEKNEDDAYWRRRAGFTFQSGDSPRLPPAAWSDGIHFAGVFSDFAVLQRAPQRAALYGVVVSSRGDLSETSLQVDVELSTDNLRRRGQSLRAQHLEVVNATYARWKVVLEPMDVGGSFDVTASCRGCAPRDQAAPASSLRNVTFGDVWFCSGQSNMWLPMHFAFSRNRTYDAVRKGKYRNIRMFTADWNAQPDAAWPSYDPYIAPPPTPYQTYGTPIGGGWLLPDVGMYPCEGRPLTECSPARGSDEWINNTIDQFSATCWYFAETLSDLAEANGEAVVPFGLVQSSLGGTMVEHWQPNASLNAGACRSASGEPYSPSQLQRWDIDAGALWNGMVLPFVNMTIKGALWYQGENNIFQCLGGQNAKLGDPFACGKAVEGTGYGCFLQSLINSWRATWSSGPESSGTTPSDFPFGIASLAGGTSEGFPNHMGAFRLSQAGGTGLLPTAAWPNTFLAQTYDLGDPGSGPAGAANWYDGQGAYASERGVAPFTSIFMGEVHPRTKRAVGQRLALAARALVYKDRRPGRPWTGPVLSSCNVEGGTLRLVFNSTLFQGDVLAVRRSASTSTLPLSDPRFASSPALAALLASNIPGSSNDFLFTSPLEVQYGGTGYTDGVWLPATLQPKCADGGNENQPGGFVSGNKVCGLDPATGQPLPDFNVALASLPLGAFNASEVTAVRYAFRDRPCCPGVNKDVVPCPPASCPLQNYNSTLPAVPFVARIQGGACSWISTDDVRGGETPQEHPKSAADDIVI